MLQVRYCHLWGSFHPHPTYFLVEEKGSREVVPLVVRSAKQGYSTQDIPTTSSAGRLVVWGRGREAGGGWFRREAKS